MWIAVLSSGFNWKPTSIFMSMIFPNVDTCVGVPWRRWIPNLGQGEKHSSIIMRTPVPCFITVWKPDYSIFWTPVSDFGIFGNQRAVFHWGQNPYLFKFVNWRPRNSRRRIKKNKNWHLKKSVRRFLNIVIRKLASFKYWTSVFKNISIWKLALKVVWTLVSTLRWAK